MRDSRPLHAATRLKVFAAGAAHIDRRGRPTGIYRPHASNPGVMTETAGGAMLNAAQVLRRFEAEVILVSARGGDPDAERVAAAVAEAGIHDLALTWLDRRTPTYTALLDGNGDLVAGLADMALYDLMSPRVFSRRHIREAMAACDAVMLDANLPAPALERLVDLAGERPVTAISVSPAKVRRLLPLVPRLAALFLSRAEAASLVEATPVTGLGLLAELVMETGVRRAVITDGASDAAIIENGALLLQSPPPVRRLRDVTGAGDTLAAVATHGLCTGLSFQEAVRLGMAAASRRISADSGRIEGPQDLADITAAMAPPRPADD